MKDTGTKQCPTCTLVKSIDAGSPGDADRPLLLLPSIAHDTRPIHHYDPSLPNIS